MVYWYAEERSEALRLALKVLGCPNLTETERLLEWVGRAVEVERISEGQRFTTRLLNEREKSLPG